MKAPTALFHTLAVPQVLGAGLWGCDCQRQPSAQISQSPVGNSRGGSVYQCIKKASQGGLQAEYISLSTYFSLVVVSVIGSI